mgnify:CR=1 FL=1
MLKLIGVEMVENELDLIEQIKSINVKLGGTIQRLTTYNSKGATSKKIIIEYDVQEKPA